MKNRSTMYWIIGIIIFFGLMIFWQKTINKNSPNILSRNGFHWHPELTVYVKGVKQEIPSNIGIGAVHQPIHTHNDSNQGVIHMEFQGIARKENATLGQFFKNWGKDINSFGANMKMTVNGEENTEYENYVMQDKDKIELYYE